MTDIVFVDVETTGLDPHKHTIVEIALIKGKETIHAWIMPTDSELGAADSGAVRVNRFYQRTQGDLPEIVRRDDTYDYKTGEWNNERSLLAGRVGAFTAHCILAGNAVKFDQQFLEAWMRKHGACPAWDYHVLDVPTYAAGVMMGHLAASAEPRQDLLDLLEPPFKSSKISQAMLCPEPEGEDKHTAMADAQWSKKMWEMANAQA